jgi:hypothetical protein
MFICKGEGDVWKGEGLVSYINGTFLLSIFSGIKAVSERLAEEEVSVKLLILIFIGLKMVG